MKVELTSEQKIALEKLQREIRNHYVRDRIHCVLFASEGWSTKLIAQLQRIHETTVRRHLDDWFNEEKMAPKIAVPTAIWMQHRRRNSLHI